jgi:Ca2+-binding RTX toxin-like protein
MRIRRRVALFGIGLVLVITGTVHAATVVGGSTGDVIRGTAEADELYGLAGNDRMYGGRGADLIIGSFGNDLLEGGPGGDVLLGGPGQDKLVGGPGRDTLIGGPGNDLIVAKDGARDFVDCGPGRDQIIRDPFDHIENCEKRKVKPPAGGFGGEGGSGGSGGSGSGGSGGSGGGGSQPPPPPSPKTSKLTVKADAGGAVTSTPAGISCPGQCTARFASGAKVALRATPSKNRRFARWQGSCSGTSSSCSVTLSRDRWVRAMFDGSPSPPPPSPPPPPAPPPPPPPSPPPPPAGGGTVVTTSNWTCEGPVNLDLVKVTMQSGGDAITLGVGCTGRIGRIEIDTWREDGVKVQNNGNAAHDLVIGSGYIRCHDVAGGAHQDGVQAMGGARITFRNISIDCLGNSNFFVNRAGSGSTTPTDIVCEGCFLGPRSSTTIRINAAVRSGARGTTMCPGRNQTDFWGDPSSINESNTVLARTDPRCR